ncbi:MAG: carboxypeptidase-like regulatory domain-containing protein, partial [Bacteroidetes bacterium]|nr:carboxypeptidase-like regulatory domain-containing protein [Bacteroidota bacterium]
MKRFLIVVACLFIFCRATAQNTLKALVRNDQTKEALKGATVTIHDLNLSAITDSAGNAVIGNIPNGMHIVSITYVGFSKQERAITFPVFPAGQAVIFDMEPQEGELGGITIETTRTNQSLKDIPTRVEVLPTEELEEKNTERPGDVKMLLAETTGILLQNTSAVSGSASFRIQGLDSRYTQLLQDGMPMYA